MNLNLQTNNSGCVTEMNLNMVMFGWDVNMHQFGSLIVCGVYSWTRVFVLGGKWVSWVKLDVGYKEAAVRLGRMPSRVCASD